MLMVVVGYGLVAGVIDRVFSSSPAKANYRSHRRRDDDRTGIVIATRQTLRACAWRCVVPAPRHHASAAAVHSTARMRHRTNGARPAAAEIATPSAEPSGRAELSTPPAIPARLFRPRPSAPPSWPA